MSGKRKVRRVLVMIDYGDGDSANGEVFDLTALALEMAPHSNYGIANLELKVSADKTYKQAPEPAIETTVSFGGYAGARFISGATHLDDVVNASLPDGDRVQELTRKRKRMENKMRDLDNDVMVARLRQASEIRHSHPIARFNEPLPELHPGIVVAPALAAGGYRERGRSHRSRGSGERRGRCDGRRQSKPRSQWIVRCVVGRGRIHAGDDQTARGTSQAGDFCMSRDFTYTPAVPGARPLILAISGPSGSGKTFTSLRVATGMREVFGGEIALVDNESGRALHYADKFKFNHIPFAAPYSPDDYRAVTDFALSKNPSVLIFDQFTYEHDGEGGVLQWQESELDRMAGDNWGKRQACNQAAWIKPKAARKKLINHLISIGSRCAIILLFRAKESVKQVKNTTTGKAEMVPQGITPIGGAEYVFEATASVILPPASKGVPTWQTEFKGEQLFMKLPDQFAQYLNGQLTEETGRQLAMWSRGIVATPPDIQALTDVGETKAREGTAILRAWWGTLPAAAKATLKPKLDGDWKQLAQDAAASRRSAT